MTIKSSGTSLSFTEIAAEFGAAHDHRFGRYRVNYTNNDQGGGYSSSNSLPLDAGIPQSGPIRFSDFYSKQLNVVVRGYGGSAEDWSNKNATAVYDNNEVDVVGGFRSRPARNASGWQGGKTVKINVNKVIGSSRPPDNKKWKCAVKTGIWPNETVLSVDVGPEGVITGAGGEGGNGGANCGSGEGGQAASSGLGIQHTGDTTVNVASGGLIQCGYGGGGGGGGAVRDPNKEGEDQYVGGGGGGGGAGWPPGEGGHGANTERDGEDGEDGTLTSGGEGGEGGSPGGGKGGEGGDHEEDSEGGGGGSSEGPKGCEGEGGSEGNPGDAIRSVLGSGEVFINNSGTIRGDTEYNIPASRIT